MKRSNNEVETNSILDTPQTDDYVLSSPMPEKKAIKPMWKSIGIVALAVAVLLGVFAVGGLYFENQYQKELAAQYDKEAKAGLTYFEAEKTEPEKSKEAVTSLITKAYYTNDGSLAVQICFANGMAEDKRILSVETKILNGKEEVIATGYSDNLSKNYVIAANGTKQLILYISPEYVKIKDDPLDTITYDVTAKYEIVK